MSLQAQLFSGLPVRDHQMAVDWYETFFGRGRDEVIGDEALWQVHENAWIFVAPDAVRAGGGLITIGVTDLEAFLARWAAVGVTHEPVEQYGNGVRHVTVVDPDRNSISLAEAPAELES